MAKIKTLIKRFNFYYTVKEETVEEYKTGAKFSEGFEKHL
jgi:hypothetical protein